MTGTMLVFGDGLVRTMDSGHESVGVVTRRRSADFASIFVEGASEKVIAVGEDLSAFIMDRHRHLGLAMLTLSLQWTHKAGLGSSVH